MARGRRSELLLILLLLLPFASAFTLLETQTDDFVTIECSDSWVVGHTYDITIKTRESVKEVSVSIVDVNGNGFSPDTMPVGENSVYVYTVKVPVVDAGDYWIHAEVYNTVSDFSQVKPIHIRNSLWRWMKLEYALFIDWWSS